MANKLLDFQASITELKQINPLFSTCKVRILYTGKNRNMSIITKDAVEKALPTIVGVPIVGEFSTEVKDYKGHGGKLDMNDYKYIHTTKPYGFVPESATYEWEEVRGKQYLSINGCVLWTGRYEEAYSVIDNGKGQSMEIEVTSGGWNESEEAYQIDNFIFSALCILGDDVEPAFEDANITAYSLDKDSFKQEFTQMLNEFKVSLKKDKEVDLMLKDLLAKYSTSMEELTAKGLNFSEISEDEIEAKIIEALEVKEPEATEPAVEPTVEPEATEPVVEPIAEPEATEPIVEPEAVEPEVTEPVATEPIVEPEVTIEPQLDFEAIQAENENLKSQNAELEKELESLRQFKLEVEKTEHEAKVQTLFSNFQLTEEDVKDLDIHAFSVEEIEEKCYAILGRKMASKKDFSLDNKDGVIKVPVSNTKVEETPDDDGYGGLFKKYKRN